MSNRDTHQFGHQIYSKRYFDASPTWFQWNRLTASDVHALREERHYEGQNVYFHLNHPIRYVRLVGLVVDIEVKSDKYILISLDDSSGSCIEVKTQFRDTRGDDHAEWPSNTVVDTVDVHVKLGITTVYINKTPIDIGVVLKVKGTIDCFRQTRQLRLERAWVVQDTNEEAKAWSETAQWRRDVLAKPWVLTTAQRDRIDEQIALDAAKDREKLRKRKAWDAKDAEKRKRHLEKHESRRRRKEEKYNAGALLGSNVPPGRVTDS